MPSGPRRLLTSLLPVAAVLLVAGCALSPPPPPPPGSIPAGTGGGKPLVVLRHHLDTMAELLSGGGQPADPNSETRRRLEDLAREAAVLLSDGFFDAWPLTRSRFQTRVLFVTETNPEARTEALSECMGMLEALEARAALPSPPP